MAEALMELTSANFEAEVLKSSVPVFVDFWASWCEPCKRIEPVIQELAQKYEGRVRFAKVNVEQQAAIAQRYQVRAMPTFIVFKNGMPVATQLAAVPKSNLIQFIDKAV